MIVQEKKSKNKGEYVNLCVLFKKCSKIHGE